jgi:hypothetical protein
MNPRNAGRTAAVALAVAAVLTPMALAKPIPDGPDTEVVTNAPDTDLVTDAAATTRPLKPVLLLTSPDTIVTLDLYLGALAGTATTSE